MIETLLKLENAVD